MQTTSGRLARRADHRLIAGVAGGLADYTGTAAAWWRLGFILMTVAGGLGVLTYLVLWWLLPRADLPQSAAQRVAARIPDAPSTLGAALLMLGVILLVAQFDLWNANVGGALLLIGVGVILYRREADRRGMGGESTGTAASPEDADEASGRAELAPWADATTPLAERRPPRERSWLGWLSLGAALAVGGALWMAREAGVAEPSLAQLLAAPLTVLGIGLLVGSWAGRARWTAVPGLALVPIVLVVGVITVPLEGAWEDRYLRPHTAAELRPAYRQSGSSLVLDLSRLCPGQHPEPIRATMGVGDIQVVLPKGSPSSIAVSAGLGSVSVLGRSRGGLGISDEVRSPGSSPIEMDLEVGIGNVSVYQRPPRERRLRGCP